MNPNNQPLLDQLPLPKKRPTLKIAIFATIGIVLIAAGVLTAWLLASSDHGKTSQQANDRSLGNASTSLSTYYDAVAKYGIPAFTANRKTELLAAFDQLAGDFVFTDAAFDDTSAMHALAVADRYLRDKADKDTYRTELYLLFQDKLTKLPDGIKDSTFKPASKQQDEETIKTLQKYQDKDLSASVLASPVLQKSLDNAVAKLRLPGRSSLAPYHIIAYNFDADSQQFNNLVAEHSLFGATPKMWVEGLNGEIYIMMLKPYADEVINGEVGSLPHEFIHGQSVFVRGEAGRMIEERRAEALSGDTSAYYDAKQLFIYTKVLSGIDMLALLNQHPAEPAAFYAALYKQLGVDATNELVFSWPNAYGNTPSRAAQAIYARNSQDKALQRALALGKKDQSALDARLKVRYEKLLSVFGDKDGVRDDLQTNLAGVYRMPTAADAMQDYMKQQ